MRGGVVDGCVAQELLSTRERGGLMAKTVRDVPLIEVLLLYARLCDGQAVRAAAALDGCEPALTEGVRRTRRFDFTVTFAARKATPCPP
eukprot:2187866-Rhodomonas_salina.2